MHPNPLFRNKTDARNLAFARDRGFGVLAIDGPLLAHVPFVISDDGSSVALHLMRSNPVLRACGDGCAAVIAVSGPDGYISPDWYGLEDQVPTWNYVAVHLRGTLEPLPNRALRPMLDRLSLEFETRMTEKTPWQTHKMTHDVRDRLMRAIVPLQMRLDTIDGTWKLGQNKTNDARCQAADSVAAFGIGAETDILAALMRGVQGQ